MRGAFGLLSLVIGLGIVAYLALQPAKTAALKPASPAPNARSQAEQQARDAVNAALQQGAARASEAEQ
jgi:hypothetical protein